MIKKDALRIFRPLNMLLDIGDYRHLQVQDICKRSVEDMRALFFLVKRRAMNELDEQPDHPLWDKFDFDGLADGSIEITKNDMPHPKERNRSALIWKWFGV